LILAHWSHDVKHDVIGKTEVHEILHCRQRRTEPQPLNKITRKEISEIQTHVVF